MKGSQNCKFHDPWRRTLLLGRVHIGRPVQNALFLRKSAKGIGHSLNKVSSND